MTDLDGPGVEDHAPEGAVLDVLVVVGDVDPPLAGLVGLEGGEEGAVLVAHRAAQRPVRRRVRGHLLSVSHCFKIKRHNNPRGEAENLF